MSDDTSVPWRVTDSLNPPVTYPRCTIQISLHACPVAGREEPRTNRVHAGQVEIHEDSSDSTQRSSVEASESKYPSPGPVDESLDGSDASVAQVAGGVNVEPESVDSSGEDSVDPARPPRSRIGRGGRSDGSSNRGDDRPPGRAL